MSERIRQSVLSSLFGSNRFVVAACAAVAMVLGAMSVGASVFDLADTTTQTSITSTAITASGTATRTPEKTTLTQQRTIEPRIIIQQGTATAPSQQPTASSKAKYPLNELLTPLASSLFIGQSQLLGELQSRVNSAASTLEALTVPTTSSAAAESVNPSITVPPTENNPVDPAPTPSEPAPSPEPESPSATNGTSSLFSNGDPAVVPPAS